MNLNWLGLKSWVLGFYGVFFFLVWIFCLGRKYGCGWILIMVMLVLQNSVLAGISGSGKHNGHFFLFSLSFFLLVADVVGMFLSTVARWWCGQEFCGAFKWW